MDAETTALSAREREGMAAWFCHNLWGSREGLVLAVSGVGGRFVGGSYEFKRGNWRPQYYPWPDDRRKLPRLLVEQGLRHDVYVGVLLKSSPNNHAEYALPGGHCWADLDGPPSTEGQVLLSRLMSDEDSFSVISGARGGRHVYVALDGLYDPSRLKAASQSLAAGLGADAGHSPTKVLRLPGTFNYKPCAASNGAAPAPVVVEGW